MGYQQWFLFAGLEEYSEIKWEDRHWYPYKAKKEITSRNGVKGEIRYLDYHTGFPPRTDNKTDWRMIEYGLQRHPENRWWVLCRLGKMGSGPQGENISSDWDQNVAGANDGNSTPAESYGVFIDLTK